MTRTPSYARPTNKESTRSASSSALTRAPDRHVRTGLVAPPADTAPPEFTQRPVVEFRHGPISTNPRIGFYQTSNQLQPSHRIHC